MPSRHSGIAGAPRVGRGPACNGGDPRDQNRVAPCARCTSVYAVGVKTRLGREWQPLLDAAADAAGKNSNALAYIRDALGISQTTFQRATRGQSPWSPDVISALAVLCDMLDVPNPLESAPAAARNTNLTELHLAGLALERGLPLSSRQLDRLRAAYPVAQLVELAEADETPATVLCAVQALLE